MEKDMAKEVEDIMKDEVKMEIFIGNIFNSI